MGTAFVHGEHRVLPLYQDNVDLLFVLVSLPCCAVCPLQG